MHREYEWLIKPKHKKCKSFWFFCLSNSLFTGKAFWNFLINNTRNEIFSLQCFLKVFISAAFFASTALPRLFSHQQIYRKRLFALGISFNSANIDLLPASESFSGIMPRRANACNLFVLSVNIFSHTHHVKVLYQGFNWLIPTFWQVFSGEKIHCCFFLNENMVRWDPKRKKCD